MDYAPKAEFRPKNLDGISEDQIAAHWALYEGYVNNVNTLNKQIKELVDAGKAVGNPQFAEMKRRLGFEYNGMILHEYYFQAMKPTAGDPPANVANVLNTNFGGFQKWKDEFNAIGRMRGIGWAILYQDPTNHSLVSTWVTLHEDGNLAGFKPILVMDVWEHAFAVDWKPNPAGKGSYIEAYFKNIDWASVAKRLG